MLGLHDSSALVLGDFGLHLIDLLLGEAFFEFDALVFSFDFVLFAGEGLPPGVLDEGEDFVGLGFFVAEGEEGVADEGGQSQ